MNKQLMINGLRNNWHFTQLQINNLLNLDDNVFRITVDYLERHPTTPIQLLNNFKWTYDEGNIQPPWIYDILRIVLETNRSITQVFKICSELKKANRRHYPVIINANMTNLNYTGYLIMMIRDSFMSTAPIMEAPLIPEYSEYNPNLATGIISYFLSLILPINNDFLDILDYFVDENEAIRNGWVQGLEYPETFIQDLFEHMTQLLRDEHDTIRNLHPLIQGEYQNTDNIEEISMILVLQHENIRPSDFITLNIFNIVFKIDNNNDRPSRYSELGYIIIHSTTEAEITLEIINILTELARFYYPHNNRPVCYRNLLLRLIEYLQPIIAIDVRNKLNE